MGRAPCCAKVGLNRGPWSAQEDAQLTQYIQTLGEGQWRSLPKQAGLLRCGKSCRLRWMNYLRPDIKRGNITPEEDDIIIRMHSLLGNKWSLIAARLPSRTDNEIKNYWNSHLSKKLKTNKGVDKLTQKKVDKKRKKTGTIKIPIDDKKHKTNENITHYRVYQPKPIRAKPFLLQTNENISDSNLASASGSSSQENPEGFMTTNIEDIFPWENLENSHHNGPAAAGMINSGNHNNACNSSGFDCQSYVSSIDDSLEKVYEEYLQIINKDDDQFQFDWIL